MSLKDNISKYITTKIVDLIVILSFLAGLLFIVSLQSKYTVLYIVLVIVVYFFLSKYINKRFDNWKVQAMTIEEQKKYNAFDNLFTAAIYVVAIFLIYRSGGGKESVFLFSAISAGVLFYNARKQNKQLTEMQSAPIEAEQVNEEEPKEAEIVEEEPKV